MQHKVALAGHIYKSKKILSMSICNFTPQKLKFGVLKILSGSSIYVEAQNTWIIWALFLDANECGRERLIDLMSFQISHSPITINKTKPNNINLSKHACYSSVQKQELFQMLWSRKFAPLTHKDYREAEAKPNSQFTIHNSETINVFKNYIAHLNVKINI